MITPEDIKLQLLSTLPLYTEVFGANKSATSAIVNSTDTAVVITKAGHGLESGDIITVTEALLKVPVSSVSLDAVTDILTFTTSFYHDRTSGIRNYDSYNKATLAGFASSAFNGIFDILTIPTKSTFTISSASAPSGALGYLIEPRSLFLGPQVVTKITDDTFSVPRSDLIPASAAFLSYEYCDAQEIYITADMKRAYTEFDRRAWPAARLYVVMGPERVSKDRNTQSDAVATVNSQNPVRLTYISTVDLVVCFKILPTDAHRAAITVGLVTGEIKEALRKSMYGHVFEPVDKSVTPFAAIEIENAQVHYNIGYYLHAFTFEIPYSITIEQGDTIRREVSFRDVILKSRLFTETGQEITDTIPLEI
jgi:hypothetical protein